MADAGRKIEECENVIVGAGPAGLAVGAAMKARGLSFIMLEKAANVGARWRSHYDRLHLHTIKSLSGLPFFPFPAHASKYPSKDEVVAYLDAYAAHFDLAPRFNQQVVEIYRDNERWFSETPSGVIASKRVIMTTGYNRVPVVPDWPGRETYSGVCMHSFDYRNGEPFSGQRVLVVGVGNTGTEIALDLWERGANVSLSVRSPTNVVARDPWGVPAQVAGLLLSKLPLAWADTIGRFAQKTRFGSLDAYGLMESNVGAATGLLRDGKVAWVDIGTMELLRTKKIAVVPGVDRFLPDGVMCTDGVPHEFAAIILATGYRAGVDAILRDTENLLNERGVPNKHGVESETPGLYFVGFRNALSGQLRHIRLDAISTAACIEAKMGSEEGAK